MHPSNSGLAIIGWKSPITALINVAGFFSHLDQSCGDGVIWSVDKGNQRLASGTITIGGPPQTFGIPGVSVRAGQVLYFVVDPNIGDFCDTSGVDVKITKAD